VQDYIDAHVDGGVRLIISDCRFEESMAFKYGAVIIGDIWPITFDLRDSVFTKNGCDRFVFDWEVGWFRTSLNVTQTQ
jgi:hypothetical protein